MLTRIIVAVVLAPFFFWVLLAPPAFCLALLLSGICALASYELLKATQVAHHNLMYVFTALAAVIVPLGYWSGYGSLVTRAVALVLMSALFFVAILRYDEEKPLGLEQVMVCMFGGLLIPMFLSSLIVLRGMEHGRWLVLLPVICAFLTDAGAYFAGVFLGRHRGITRGQPQQIPGGLYRRHSVRGGVPAAVWPGPTALRWADGVPAHSGPVWPAGQRRHRAGGPVLLPHQAAVWH